MDYEGVFSDLVEMWSRAVNAASISESSRRYLDFAQECLDFEREIFNREIR